MTDPRLVLGLDLSLQSTGIAYPTGETVVVDGSKVRGPQRLGGIVDAVFLGLWPSGGMIDLAVIEGYSYGARGNALFELAELGGIIRWELHKSGIPWLVVPPSSLKRYATGKGTANKTAMVIAARDRLGYERTDDNEADALWLRAIGLDLLGEPVCSLPIVNRNVLHGLTFPVGVEVDW